MCVSTWRLHYKASTEVYCPYAINRFFSVVKSKNKVPYFASYWMRSANAASALSTYMRQHALEPAEIKELCEQQFTLSYDEITASNYFGPVTFKQLLVQAGYFSVLAIFLVLTARTSNAKELPSSAQLLRHRAAVHTCVEPYEDA